MAEITVQRAIEIAEEHQRMGRTAEAESLFRQLQGVVGENPIALNGLGKRAMDAGLGEVALHFFRRAVTLQPNLAEAHTSIGILLRADGKTAEALEAFQLARTCRPQNLEYLYNVSSSLRALDRAPEAIEISRQMIALSPALSAGHFEMGQALEETGRRAEAIECYRRAAQLQPNLSLAWHHLGVALGAECQFGEAIDALGRAAELDARDYAIQVDLGHIFHETKQFQAGADAFGRAISLRLSHIDLRPRRKDILFDTGMHEQAITCFEQTIALDPKNAWSICNLAWVLHELGGVSEAIALQKVAIELMPDNPLAYDNLLNSLRLVDSVGPEELLLEHQRWAARFADPLSSHIPVHANDRSPERMLRVGYVSPDFRSHPVGIFIMHVLAGHDRGQFHITCYSNSSIDDLMTRRIRSAVQGWHVTHDWSDEHLAAQIIEDKIDVLVDLAQHTAGHRLLVFARKPAPVQVTYLGYPGTTGLKTFDAQISDRYIDPPGQSERFSTEPIARLETYWCFRPIADAPAVQPPPAIAAGYITFGSLNKLEKSSVAAMRLWAAILKRVPRSRLLLVAPQGTHRKRMRDIFSAEGVDPQRVEFVAKQPIRLYFELYNRIDVALDPFPYNGGTTTCQSLWMGVPVVTLAGTSAVQRSGVSLLSNVGLPELIAQTPAQYVQIAADLAGDLPRLSGLREGLRDRMKASPLMDLPRFVRNLEAIYRGLWRDWCNRQSEG